MAHEQVHSGLQRFIESLQAVFNFKKMPNVRNYTDSEIINRVKSLSSFKTIPQNFWLAGVRSDEDAFNLFDDKFYLFKGEKCVAVWRGTTNAGSDLLNPTNKRGEAVLKADGIYYDSHTRRKHRGKVMAYCQAKSLPIHRDNNKNKKTEETGTANLENVGINIHPSSYQTGSTAPRSLINAWSQGCQVFAVRSDFDKFMRLTEGQQNLTYCLLKEFTPSKALKVSATVPATKPATINQPAETDNSAEIPSVLTPEAYEQPPNDLNADEASENLSEQTKKSETIIEKVERYGDTVKKTSETITDFQNNFSPISKTSWAMVLVSKVFGLVLLVFAWAKDNWFELLIAFGLIVLAAWLYSKAKDRAVQKTLKGL